MSPDSLVSPPWGRQPDTLPFSPPLLTPALSMHLVDTPEDRQKERDDKLPHDASVFVGSLPSNMDQGDLTRMLMDHLSEHNQIKNIKVVRDSKGGVCAFVQCENATSATALIQTLHSSAPKPFLGRILRYEPARAFRSLLISYRTPTQLVGPLVANPPTITNAEIELDLPEAMRIWKHRSSRFHSILYNSEAKQAEENHDRALSDGPSLDNILFLDPLKFDEQTLQRVASYFGSLEKFAQLNPTVDDISQDNQGPTSALNPYPEVHRAPRSLSMDTACWEVKWEHRDDCVSALMTLRRVPHLTVTWAHQPASLSQVNHLNHHQGIGPSYPFHTHHRPLPFHSFVPKNLPIVSKFQKLGEAQHDASVEPVIVQRATLFQDLSVERGGTERELTCRSWAEEPITVEDHKLSQAHKQEKNEPAVLSQPPWASQEYPYKEFGTEKSDDNPNEDHTRETNFNDSPEAGVQELYMPPTPALDSFTITPVTPGSQFPITPTSSGADLPLNMSCKGSDAKEPPSSFKGPRTGREIDPTTLFVGGLEMFGSGAWDEEKVRGFFSRFGGLESVKLVRPLNACAAFAFVKFDNAEAPARAVFEEHNRVYEGRAMRVQLRDCNPPRNNWKFMRGRGRPHQHHFGVPRRLSYRPSFAGQERGSFHTNGADNTSFQNPNPPLEIQLSSLADALPAGDRTSKRDIPPALGPTGPSSLSLGNASASGNVPSMDKYREWYDDPESPARTPEPSSLGSSASTAGIPFSSPYAYAMPNGPYLPPPPWMHPYSPHGPYQMPYYPGYPVYAPTAPQQPQQALTTPPGSDVGGPTAATQHNWPHMGIYTSYIPYPAAASRTQTVEQGQAPQPHMAPQAPVVPTGFIQNEQGTLIAVYQPDVLDQYLSGSGPPPTSMAQYSSSAQQRWDYIPPQAYEPGNTSHTTPAQNRMKTTGFSASPSQQMSAPQRGMESNATAPLYHRQGGGRRETQHAYSPVRQHTHPRSFHNGRPTRAYPAHIHADPGYPIGQSANPGDWNRWNNVR
ncbi:hypothetical protein GALMADRAFT_234290 [Galerina marginata CBS 339.88]|uniref:RRM domain-containing protein n=1 Tax=Galerina marginata (strain CBS 339.88) TaxID=685588 RepID=A0A067U235_GALM3|nr:hypothetical protein GALMADRAFT_234290 [Galerina marginata CBS 339.88]